MKKPLRAIFHGLRHEHAPGKLATLAKLRDDFEIVAAVDDRASTTPASAPAVCGSARKKIEFPP